MKFARNKTKNKTGTTAIALILMLTVSGMIISMSTSKAAAATQQASHAFVNASPNPIGVGQTVFIDMWLIEVDPVTNGANNGQATGTGTSTATGVWTGYKLTITEPNGENTTMGPYTASDAGTVDVTYKPTQTGTYRVTFNFPGQQVSGLTAFYYYLSEYFEPSSATCTFTVQSTPINGLPQTPLPTAYWTNPIDWQNQQWYSIAGNWFATTQWNTPSTYNPDEASPESAHIMWTQPLAGAFGGQIGGSLYSATDLSNYYTGKSYETFFNPPVIINGVLFYNAPNGIQPKYGTYAINLRTGQQIWYSNNTGQPQTSIGLFNNALKPGITYGEVFSHHNPNEVGGLAYLWGVSGPSLGGPPGPTTYSMYDATTGNWILNVVNSAGGTAVTGPEGELLVYNLQPINATTGFLSMWNSTLEVGATEWKFGSTYTWTWRPPTGASLPWSLGIQWNVTVPIYSAPNSYANSILMPAVYAINDGVILVTTGAIYYPQNYQMEAGYSATTGAFLWDANRSVAQEPGETQEGLMGPVSNGVYTEYNKATLQYYGFSITTGKQLWGPTNPLPYAENSYGSGGTADHSIFISNAFDGLYAFNLTTGAPVWNWTSPPAGLQEANPYYTIYGCTPVNAGSGSDEMVYVGASNTHGDQLFRGAQLYGVNATNGQLVWSVDGFFITLATGDGELVGFNAYDNQIYAFGMGPSKTTVTAPNVGVTTATPVTITGTVTDISAGSQQNAVAANFPNGLPCVSAASMSQFMEAVYEQQPMPTNITGVPVTLYVLDSNNNYRSIGTTTTNAQGEYGFTWTPDIPGNYTVYAVFGGTGAYYGSSASTYFYAGSPAATAPPTATPVAGLASNTTVEYIGIAIIVVIIIIGAVLAILVTRRHP